MNSVPWIPIATYKKMLIILVSQMWSVQATTVITPVLCASCCTNGVNVTCAANHFLIHTDYQWPDTVA